MTPFPTRTDDAIAFLDDLAQLRANEALDAEYERRERIEAHVTFDDVLEEMATSCTEPMKRQFMVSLARATHADADALFMLIEAAKQRVVTRRLAAGE